MPEEQSYPTSSLIAAGAAAVIVSVILHALIRVPKLPHYGLELPVVAFLVGLAVSAAASKYRGLFQAAEPWIFVDASLIILGISANFSRLGGLNGAAGELAVINVAAGLAIGILVALRLGLDEKFTATFVSGATICGITAAIATGRAVKAEYPHLLIAMLLIAIVGAPFAIAIRAYAANAAANLGGALIGAVVDSTPVVSSIADAIGGKTGKIAMAVKMAQNALIPIVAIALAVLVSRISGEEPVIPLSLVLMLLGAIAFSFINVSDAVSNSWEMMRKLLLGAAMFMAGAATPIEALKKPGVHLAIAVFILVEIVNIVIAAALGPALLPS